MRDIVLIGMPGCGKTTIGRQLADKLNMEFVDSDIEIERRERLCIPEIFKNRGESYFRECETAVLKDLLGSGCVIATGGGVVLNEDNVNLLKKSDTYVVFIDRPIENIMSDIRTEDRPLLMGGKENLIALYNERYEKYLAACDVRILNDEDADTAVDKIENLYKGE